MGKSLMCILLFISVSCTHQSRQAPTPSPLNEMQNIILANELLTKIYEGVLSPNKCIVDKEEAELLLKTLGPKFEEVVDQYQAKLDDDTEIENFVKSCGATCTCHFIQELFTQNEIKISKKLNTEIKTQISGQVFKACLVNYQLNFCQSELYLNLEKEKESFKLD